MAVYILFLITIFPLAYLATTVKSGEVLILRVILFSLPIFFYGLRYYTGTDYENYKMDFYEIYTTPENSQGEWLYLSIVYILKNLSLSDEVIFFIAALLTIIIFYRGIAKFDISPTLPTLFFSIMYGPNLFMGGLRIGLAIAISIHFISCVKNRKLLTALMFIIIAVGVHRAAIMVLALLPIIFIYSRGHPKKYSYLIFMAAMLIFYFAGNIIYSADFSFLENLGGQYAVKILSYTEYEIEELSVISIVKYLSVVLFYLIGRFFISEESKRLVLDNFFAMALFGYFLNVVLISTPFSHMILRGANFFTFSESIVLGMITSSALDKRKINGFLLFASAYFFSCAGFISKIYAMSDYFLPYKSIFYKYF